MMNQSTRSRGRALVVLPVLLGAIAACNEPSQAPDAPTAATVAFSQTDGADAQLARLRSVIAPFHNFEKAKDAEYTAPLTGCMVDEKLGGMGFHYGKGSAIDATVNPLEPEALLYEPEENGKLRLVAVEFLVPYALVSRDGPAPRAFGQDFVRNDVFELWTLHAWIFKHNPAGMFADWNPEVNCDAVPAAARMSH
jgi:hypothetical protein